jgi:hypothetical protein
MHVTCEQSEVVGIVISLSLSERPEAPERMQVVSKRWNVMISTWREGCKRGRVEGGRRTAWSEGSVRKREQLSRRREPGIARDGSSGEL